jgi:DNA-binding CsgD family transcriptional regulator
MSAKSCAFNRSMQHHLNHEGSPEVVFMAQGKRVEVSAAQRAEMWRRWKVGQSLHEIGRAYGRTPSSIHLLLSHHGGIVPTVRRRSPQALTLTEREDISRGIASGSSMREIAMSLSRAASTVSREVARHGGRSMYRAKQIRWPGSQPGDPSCACWPPMSSCEGSSSLN